MLLQCCTRIRSTISQSSISNSVDDDVDSGISRGRWYASSLSAPWAVLAETIDSFAASILSPIIRSDGRTVFDTDAA